MPAGRRVQPRVVDDQGADQHRGDRRMQRPARASGATNVVASNSAAVGAGTATTHGSGMDLAGPPVDSHLPPGIDAAAGPVTRCPVRTSPPAARTAQASGPDQSVQSARQRRNGRSGPLTATAQQPDRTGQRAGIAAAPGRAPGATVGTSRRSGSAAYTPPATGSTRRSSTRRPIRERTTAPRVEPAGRPARPGRTASRAALRYPRPPDDPADVGRPRAAGDAEQRQSPAAARIRRGAGPRRRPGSAPTIRAARPSSSISSVTEGRAVANDSAPASRVRPPTRCADSTPPQLSAGLQQRAADDRPGPGRAR